MHRDLIAPKAQGHAVTREARFSQLTASVLLDAVRGAAAILVLLEHWRSAFFVDLGEVHAHRMLLKPLYILSGAGRQAVIVFFVLSGYLIGGTVIRSIRQNEWSWAQYSMHRLTRLWVVLLPALLLGGLWDCLGMYLHQAPVLYAGLNHNHLTPDVGRALSLKDLLGNAAFLQWIAVPPYGSNGPLWSLAMEFWFYVIFPVGFCLFAIYLHRPLRAISCLIILCLVAYLTKYALVYLPIWLLGALLYITPCRPTAPWQRLAATFFYGVLFFAISALDLAHSPARMLAADMVLGTLTFGYLWVLLGAMQEAKQTIGTRLSRSTARFSYTLYVAHTPILILMVSLTAHDARWTPNMASYFIASAVLVLIVLYAWLVARATEFNTTQVRSWIERRLKMMPTNH